MYLSAEIDNFDSLVYANSSRSQYFDTKLRWEDAGGVLVLKLSQELTQAGKDYYKKEAEEWGYTFYEDDYSGESSVSFSYRINGKTLTVTYEGISIAFTRSSGSGGLAGTWDVDLESVRKAILDYADNETAEKIAKVIKLDGADKLSVSLNKNGTIFASARLFAGTYADGSVMLREEVQQVLSEERLNIGIKYEEKGSKIFLTLTPYERGRQSGDAVILVLRKV